MMNNLTATEIRAIVEKAAFLYERIGGDYVPAPAPDTDEATAADLLKQWRQQAAFGEEDDFERRLSWDGLTRDSAQAIIRGVQLREGAALPPWAGCLAEALEEGGQMAKTAVDEMARTERAIDASNALPFEHILVPFVRYGRRMVESNARAGYGKFSGRAHAILEHALLQTLSTTASATLQLEFSTWLALQTQSYQEEDRYGRYVEEMLSGGLGEVVQRYPVMGRLLAQATILWCSFVGDILNRLLRDLPEIEEAFGGGKPLGCVADVGARLSDAHNGGTTVVRLTFESGVTCYYKPKDITSERLYNELLAWMNATGALLPFYTVRSLCRPGYGWVQSVETVAMTSQEEAARYFERAGMLLCILYVVGGNDCIVENIIPHGEHPVLIDTETFFQPLPNLAYKSSWGASSAASRELFQNSVLRVGMLPRWQGGQDGNKNDISAFGGYAGARGQFQKKVWESINTERMRYAWKTVPVSFAPSELNGKPIFPGDYVNEIVTGFTKMYQMCIAHRDALIARGGPIDNMKELKLRFLVRSTYIYDGMIHSIQTPRYQTDGMRTSVQVDSLARPYTLSEERPVPWNLIATEHASILQLDVPRFTTTPSSASLGMSSGQKIEDFFVEPSFESMKRQLFVLDRQDLELQIAYIRGSFTQPNQQTVVGDRAVNQVNGKDVLESDEAIGEALEIAERIEKSAIRASDGTATWITHGYNPDSQFWQLQPMGFRLYDGVLGTVLFLAAAHNAEKTNGFRDLALASFKNLLDTSTKTVRLGLLQDGLGAGLGLSSVIYSLLLSGQLLEEPGLIAQAERVADLITRETIQNDRRLDTLGGSAGCLLVLLKLYEATRNERLLDLAILCGEHLVESRTVASNGCLSWQTVQGKYLAGFSHGAAGIGYALCRLSQTTGDARYRNAAVNAYEYENTLFDEKARNWANLLSPSDGTGQEFWTSWCHGAPGIGLGRIGSMSDREDATYETDLKHALESAATAPLNHVDNLCCGTMGRLEVLLEAERTLGLEDCGRQARLIAKQVVRNAKEQGRYNLGLDAGICVPSFHQGMAGIGYQLLRVTDPVRYPSVLSWQSASLS